MAYAEENALHVRPTRESDLRGPARLLLDAELIGSFGSWEVDPATGEVIATEGNRRLFFGDNAALGNRVDDYMEAIHPDDRQRVRQEYEQFLRSGSPPEMEYRVVLPGGEVRVIRGLRRVLRDANGNPVRVFGTNADVTDRKRAEHEIHKQTERAETLARIAARLNERLDLSAVVFAICEEAVGALCASQASISLLDLGTDLLVHAGGFNIPAEYARRIEPIGRAQFESFIRGLGPVMVVPDIQDLDVPNKDFIRRLDVRTVVTVVMRRHEELVGALTVGVNGRVREISPEELALLKAITDQGAQAIVNAQLLRTALEQRRQLQRLGARMVEAQERERRSIARELHDGLGQELTAVKFALEDLRTRNGDGGGPDRLNVVTRMVDEILGRIHTFALDLRPSLLDEFGLASALRWYVKRQARMEKPRWSFHTNTDGERFRPEIESAFFRIAQEAATNALKHAGASRIEITLARKAHELRVAIRDDGKGFDLASARAAALNGESLGILSMEERASSVGARVEIASRPDRGTEIEVHVPLRTGRTGSAP